MANKNHKNSVNMASSMVSIVVPVYNAEDSLARCVESLLTQDYKNIEIIIVDDGSEDSSVEIAKEFMNSDSRVKLVPQKHHGPNLARKNGVQLAGGDYIMFVDADDFIRRDAVKILVDKFKHNSVDIIKFGSSDCRKNGVMVDRLGANTIERIIDKDESLRLLLTTYELNSLHSQIYKAEKVKDEKIFDCDLRFGEDFLSNLKIYQKINRVLISKEILYFYCDNPNSTTRTVDYNRILENISSRVFISEKAIEFADYNYSDNNTKNGIFYMQLLAIRDVIVGVSKIKKYKKGEFFADFEKRIPINIFSAIDKDALKKYIGQLSFIERAKNKKMVLAILESDYNYIWKYICAYKIYMGLKFGGLK